MAMSGLGPVTLSVATAISMGPFHLLLRAGTQLVVEGLIAFVLGTVELGRMSIQKVSGII